MSLFSGRFPCCCAPKLSVSASCGDTTARAYCAGTVAAIRFRMRTKL